MPSSKPWKKAISTAVAQMERTLRGQNSIAPSDRSGIRNFLVLQFESPLGSVVHATPLFEELKHVLPDAHITVATSAMAHEVLGLNPYIDRCVRTPNPMEAFPASVGALRDLLRTMPPGKRSILTTIGNQRTRVAFIGLLAGKSFRAGYTLVPELYDVLLRFDPERGQIEANLDILRSLGHSVEFCEPKVFFSREDADHAAELLKSLAPRSAIPRIAFVTQNSGGQRNRWRQDRFSQVVTQLSETRNANPIFVGTFADVPAIEHLRQSLSNPGLSVAGKTSVRQLAALLAQCDLVVSLDTGTFHVARAVGLPGVVIAPAWQSSREWLPVNHPRYRVLQGPRIPAPPADYWIDEISVKQVIEAALDLLDQFPPSEAERTARTQSSLPLLLLCDNSSQPMGILTRILKVMAALFTSNVVNLITKLLLPPIFLYRYGTTSYGEWLALSGAVAYLSTLNFGIQTYVTQDLTVRYQRNDLDQYHLQQSTSLRVLLGILGTAAVACLVFFVLPIEKWLRLTISHAATAETLYLLAWQVLLGVLFGYFTGMYMVLSRAHTGVLWVNGLRLTMVIVTSAGAWVRLSFPVLAGLQAAVYALGILLVLAHIRWVAPEIFPRVTLWDRSAVRAILRPSSYFGLISMSTFLSYEVPVLILKREVGPFAVVAFTVMRTIFSMCRQFLNAISQAMGAEITRLFGRQEWAELTAVYTYSERLIFSLIPIVNLGVLVVSPVLLTIWLHKPALFSVVPYVLMAAISMTLSAKEHKFQFQFSTNTHEQLARIMFSSYIALAVLSVPMVKWQGMLGFLYIWFAVELYQFIRIVRLNQILFAHTGEHTLKYVYRLAGLGLAGLCGAGVVLAHTYPLAYRFQFAAGFAVCMTLAFVAFFLFDMRAILGKLSIRIRNRILSSR